MKLQPLLIVAVIGLFLYWIVQDPVGAAAMISNLTHWLVQLLQLVANRVVQFLNALV